MAGEKKVSFRLTEETKAWLREVGGGGDRGALQAGFDALVRFAQLLSLAFQAFLKGQDNWMVIGVDNGVPSGDYIAIFKVTRNELGALQFFDMEVTKCDANA